MTTNRTNLRAELQAQIATDAYAARPKLKEIINNWPLPALQYTYPIERGKGVSEEQAQDIRQTFDQIVNMESTRDELKEAMEKLGIGHQFHTGFLTNPDKWQLNQEKLNSLWAENQFHILKNHPLIQETPQLQDLINSNQGSIEVFFQDNTEGETPTANNIATTLIEGVNNKIVLQAVLTEVGVPIGEDALTQLFVDIQYDLIVNEFLRNTSILGDELAKNTLKLKERLRDTTTQDDCKTLLDFINPATNEDYEDIRRSIVGLIGKLDEHGAYVEPDAESEQENITKLAKVIFAEKQYYRIMHDANILPNGPLKTLLTNNPAKDALKRSFANATNKNDDTCDLIVEAISLPDKNKAELSQILGDPATVGQNWFNMLRAENPDNILFTETLYAGYHDDLINYLATKNNLTECRHAVHQLSSPASVADIQIGLGGFSEDHKVEVAKKIFVDTQYKALLISPLSRDLITTNEASVKAVLATYTTPAAISALAENIGDWHKNKDEVRTAMEALGLRGVTDDVVQDRFAHNQCLRIRSYDFSRQLFAKLSTDDQKFEFNNNIKEAVKNKTVEEIDHLILKVSAASTSAELSQALRDLGMQDSLTLTERNKFLATNTKDIERMVGRFKQYEFLVNRYLGDSKTPEQQKTITDVEKNRLKKIEDDLLLYKASTTTKTSPINIEATLSKIKQIRANLAINTDKSAHFGDKAEVVKISDDHPTLKEAIEAKIEEFFGLPPAGPAALTGGPGGILSSTIASAEAGWKIGITERYTEEEARVTLITVDLSSSEQHKIACTERGTSDATYQMEIRTETLLSEPSRLSSFFRASPPNEKILEKYFLVALQAYTKLEDKSAGLALDKKTR